MPTRRRIKLVPLCGLVVALCAPTAHAAPSGDRPDPSGNNGTIKIASSPSDRSPSNRPHVGCVFDIDFFGYDRGDLWAEHTVRLHPPTGRHSIVEGNAFIGEDRARGGRDHDATVTIDVAQALGASGFDPHDKQGWHLKVTVHADGSGGSDVKHKVFWSRCSRSAAVVALGARDSGTVRAAGGVVPVGGGQPASRVLGSEARADRARAGAPREPGSVSGLALTSARTLVPMGLGLTLLVSGVLLGVRLKRRAPRATESPH